MFHVVGLLGDLCLFKACFKGMHFSRACSNTFLAFSGFHGTDGTVSVGCSVVFG